MLFRLPESGFLGNRRAARHIFHMYSPLHGSHSTGDMCAWLKGREGSSLSLRPPKQVIHPPRHVSPLRSSSPNKDLWSTYPIIPL